MEVKAYRISRNYNGFHVWCPHNYNPQTKIKTYTVVWKARALCQASKNALQGEGKGLIVFQT